MAILRYYIDSRTIAGMAADATATYAHGLPAAPDIVNIGFLNVALTATTLHVGNQGIRAVADATNITLNNAGGGLSVDLDVAAICCHSMIQ
jgi:hypothetical protein